MQFIQRDPWYVVDIMGRGPNKNAPEFGRRVAEARREKGLTQVQLAEILGVKPGMIEYYECRAENVKANVLVKLSEALGVSADELLGLATPKAKPGPKSALRSRLEEAERLPRQQQKHIAGVVSALIAQARTAD